MHSRISSYTGDKYHRQLSICEYPDLEPFVTVGFIGALLCELFPLPNQSFLGAILALVVVGCGGGNSLSDVEDTLDNPTGSIMETDTVIAADQKRQSTSSATDLSNGNFLPFSIGQSGSLNRSIAMQSFKPFLKVVEELRGPQPTALDLGNPGDSFNFDSDCFEFGEEAENITITETKATGTIKGSQDISECDPTATGTVDISIKFTIKGNLSQERIDSIEMDGKVTMTDVCETVDEKACMTGTIDLGAKLDDIDEDQLEDLAIVLLSQWDLDVSWDEDGTRQQINLVGGLRFSIASTDGKIELYVEAVNGSGETVTYTFEISFSSVNASFVIRGADGTATCTVDLATEAVTCNIDGGGTIDWTQEDIDRVTADPSKL